MFSYIKGKLEYISEDVVILENNNIGFEIRTSSFALKNLTELHKEVIFYTYMYVREDEITLYGFMSKNELDIFKLLIAINGIGPKAALSILSCMTTNELKMAVISDDYKAISKANGVGAKTAQRVVIDLKDKLKIEDVFQDDSYYDTNTEKANDDVVSEVVLALSSLGYSNIDALRAVKKVKNSNELSVEELLKAALKLI